MANPLFPDITGQEYDPLWARQMAEQDIPRVHAQVQQAPDARFGPVRLNGAGLDSAALAVLGALQNQRQPQNALGSFAQGLAGGLAGGRVRQMQSRQAANEDERKRVVGDDIERRKQAAAYGRSLAQHRWTMQRDAAKEAMKKPVEPKENMGFSDISGRKDVQADLVKRGFILPTPDSKGRLMVRDTWLQPQPKEKPQGPSETEMFRRETRLSSEWKGNRSRQTFENTQQYYSRGLAESKTKDNYGDNTLIRTLAKAVDDRTGVREEENRAYEAAQALRDRLKAEFTKVANGGTLTDNSRAAIVNQLRILKDDSKTRYVKSLVHMRKRAAQWGLDPMVAIEDVASEGDEADADAEKKLDEWLRANQ